MNKTRIQIARPDIIRYFDELPSKVLHHADLARILINFFLSLDFLHSAGSLSLLRHEFMSSSLSISRRPRDKRKYCFNYFEDLCLFRKAAF